MSLEEFHEVYKLIINEERGKRTVNNVHIITRIREGRYWIRVITPWVPLNNIKMDLKYLPEDIFISSGDEGLLRPIDRADIDNVSIAERMGEICELTLSSGPTSWIDTSLFLREEDGKIFKKLDIDQRGNDSSVMSEIIGDIITILIEYGESNSKRTVCIYENLAHLPNPLRELIIEYL